jgi:hypothetical protein
MSDHRCDACLGPPAMIALNRLLLKWRRPPLVVVLGEDLHGVAADLLAPVEGGIYPATD